MIKNYTSTVPALRSINAIESNLVKHGARNILKTYTPQGKIEGLAFILEVTGKKMPFKLPARVDRVAAKLKESIKKPRKDTLKRVADQAERTSWKILSDWVGIQMALIDLDQAKIMEVFLPYLYDHNKQTTYFEQLESNDFKQLTFIKE